MHSEFEKNLKGIARSIEHYKKQIKSIETKLKPEEFLQLNKSIAILESIEHNWKEWDIKLSIRNLNYSNPFPLNWVEDKQARYDAEQAMNNIIEQYNGI